ncbi:MAG TPA: hypothetical protein VK881_13915 [bacterium]|nr:hypothetical protein [bacterium]
MDNRRRNDFNKLSREQKLELARALFQRGSDAYTAAKAAFQKVYPTAPDEMIVPGLSHTYVEGVDAALDFIAGAEMFLRDPDDEWLGFGFTYELLYHAYNWHMFLILLPEGTGDLLKSVDDLKRSVETGVDQKTILKDIEDLRDQLTGHRGLPNL